MGLAASQARLLVITARKSDLEYRGQQVNNRMLRLSYEMEEIASKYSKGVSNRKLTIKTSAGDYEDISYKQLTTSDGTAHQQYLLTNESGKVVLASKNSSIYAQLTSGDTTSNVYKYCLQKYQTDNNTTSTPSVSELSKYVTFATSDTSASAETTGAAAIDANLEEGLRSGAYELARSVTTTTDSTSTTTIKPVAYSTETCIDDELDDSDDAAVMAEYELKSAQVQSQNKQMDMELKDIDTQHKAIESEEESVKKVIESNIKSSFKTFA